MDIWDCSMVMGGLDKYWGIGYYLTMIEEGQRPSFEGDDKRDGFEPKGGGQEGNDSHAAEDQKDNSVGNIEEHLTVEEAEERLKMLGNEFEALLSWGKILENIQLDLGVLLDLRGGIRSRLLTLGDELRSLSGSFLRLRQYNGVPRSVRMEIMEIRKTRERIRLSASNQDSLFVIGQSLRTLDSALKNIESWLQGAQSENSIFSGFDTSVQQIALLLENAQKGLLPSIANNEIAQGTSEVLQHLAMVMSAVREVVGSSLREKAEDTVRVLKFIFINKDGIKDKIRSASSGISTSIEMGGSEQILVAISKLQQLYDYGIFNMTLEGTQSELNSLMRFFGDRNPLWDKIEELRGKISTILAQINEEIKRINEEARRLKERIKSAQDDNKGEEEGRDEGDTPARSRLGKIL